MAELESALSHNGFTNKDHWKRHESSGELSEAVGDGFVGLSSPNGVPPNFSMNGPGWNRTTAYHEVGQPEQDPPGGFNGELLSEPAGGFSDSGSSGVIASRMFGSMMRGVEPPVQRMKDPSQAHLSPLSMSDRDNLDAGDGSPELLRTPINIAERLLKGYVKHISTRWPVMHSSQFWDLHSRRLQLDDPFELSALSLIYAIGGRFLETTGEMGNFFPERHYRTAMDQLDKILQTHDVRAVQTLILHAVYCLRAPRRPGAW